MPRNAQEKAAKGPNTGSKRSDGTSRAPHHRVPTIEPRDPNQASKPVEAEKENRSIRKAMKRLGQ